MNSNNIGKSFSKLISYHFPNYRGVVVVRSNGGYVYNGKFCATIEELDKAIDADMERLRQSINRIKPTQQ